MVKTIRSIRKKQEFLAFIKLLKKGTNSHWQQIAGTLGVEDDTITAWKKLPEAREAIREGINDAIIGMMVAGKKDWRMWESKLKMLGISSVEKHDIVSAGKPVSILGGISVLRNNSHAKDFRAENKTNTTK